MPDQPDNLNHAIFREQIAAALAGGLSADEQSAFDAHALACEGCAKEWREAREMEKQLGDAFSPIRPVAGLEDRVIHRLRVARSRRAWMRPIPLHPMVRKAAAGLAAAIVLGGVGYTVNQVVNPGPSDPVLAASNLRQIGQAILLYFNDSRGAYPANASAAWGDTSTLVAPSSAAEKDRYGGGNVPINRGRVAGKQLYYGYQNPYPGTQAVGSGFKLNQQVGAEFAVPQDKNPSVAMEHDADGHVAYEPNPFAGVNRDNVARSELVTGDHFLPSAMSPKFAQSKDAGATNGPAESFPAQNVQSAHLSKTHALGPTDNQTWDESKTAPPPAAGPIKAQQDQAQVSHARTITDLEQQARRLIGANQNQQSTGVLDQILALDPTNAYALAARHGTQTAATQPISLRKVIRDGQLEFEVDHFDSALATITKLVNQVGGYVGTTDSQQLANGKVRGTVEVRVPPDRLGTLMLELRGIGDLKSQKLDAQDISKQYTDTQSALRAAQAMQDRLIDLIKEGKGQIKDLLAAEKELGVWRTKIEQLTGQIKYWDNQVAMATIRITLFERDIRTPASAYESESIDAGVETDDVEQARDNALKAIGDAKGRIVQSELKRLDAGQFAATIIADVPPDRSGAMLDRIRQLGRVARLEVNRKQQPGDSAIDGGGATHPPVRIEQRDTRLNLSLYNLANVAPRRTTTLNLASSDVEQTHHAILARVSAAGGRIVTSSLARSRPEQMTGSVSFEVPSAQADAVLNSIRYSEAPTTQQSSMAVPAMGETPMLRTGPVSVEVMKLAVTENPDVQNTTSAKVGFSIALVSSSAVAPRETRTLRLAASDVSSARDRIIEAAGACGARVLQSNLDQNDSQSGSASIDLDVPRTALPAMEKALSAAGQTIARSVVRSTDTENTLDSRVRVTVSLMPADKLPPRDATTMQIETSDVESAGGDLRATAVSLGGRVVDSSLSKDREGRSQSKITVEVPLDKNSDLIAHVRGLGAVRAIESGQDLRVPIGPLARARLDVTFANAEAIVSPERGLIASIRRGLSTSVTGLMWSLQLIVIGLCFVVPWALLLWGGWRMLKRRGKTPATA